MESGRDGPGIHNSLVTVLMLTPATRLMDRMELPSTSMERIWTRVSRGKRFILNIMHDRS